MPQISKIRVINFSYNDTNRHILDETFDFYNGENALLELKNGGGKSVLVQLMLQPIIPKTSLMGRKIGDFFSGKKTPSYILIEWKLEDGGGYLLTGVALAKRQSQTRENEDTANSVKHYTFTSHYRKSAAFDIENIPLVRKTTDKLHIEEFQEVRKLLAAKERELSSGVEFFADDEDKRYKDHLESFNIIQDEWKSILLKINESEGGVISIFEKCKTSLQLMNDWILKTVEKVIHKDDSDQKKLEQMFGNLVKEMINNEKFIQEKELYQAFLSEARKFADSLETLIEKIENEEEQKRRLRGMLHFLENQIVNLQENWQKEKLAIDNANSDLQTIVLEERSYEYYLAEEKVQTLETNLKVEKEQQKEIREEIDSINSEISIQKAAQANEILKRLKGEQASIEEEIHQINSNEEVAQKIKELKYSLKVAYEKELDDYSSKRLRIEEEHKSLEKNIDELNRKMQILGTKNNSLQSNQGALLADIGRFEHSEEAIQKELDFSYERNLFGEIEQQYLDQHTAFMEQKEIELNEEQQQLQQLFEKNNEKEQSANERLQSLRSEEQESIQKLSAVKREIKSYEELEKCIEAIFTRYEFNFKKRFQHAETTRSMAEKVKELERLEREQDFGIRTLAETVSSLKNGTLHVSSEFREWLIQEGIPFDTGENYLRNQETKIRQRLIKQNPVLPFSFLLYEDDLERIQSMEIGVGIRHLVPLLSYSDIASGFSMIGNTIRLSEQLRVLSLIDQRMMDAEDLVLYIQDLELEETELNEKQDHYREQLEQAREDRQMLLQFKYEENAYFDMAQKLQSAENEQAMQLEERSQLEQLQSSLRREYIEHTEQQASIANRMSNVKKLTEKFQDFIGEHNQYVKNKKQLKEKSAEINRINEERKILDEELKAAYDKREQLSIEKDRLLAEIKVKERKYQKVEDALETEILDEEIFTMEGRLQALTGKMDSNIKSLIDQLDRKKEERKNKEKELVALDVEENLYIYVSFHLGKLNELETTVTQLKQEEGEATQQIHETEKSKAREEGKLEIAEREFKKLAPAPLDRSIIKLNFSNRRKQLRSFIAEATKRIEKFREEKTEYERISNRIIDKIGQKDIEKQIAYEIDKVIQKDCNSLLAELDMQAREKVNLEKSIQNHFNKLKTQFSERNQNIKNILEGLSRWIDRAEIETDQYYYVGERLLASIDKLQQLIGISEQRLQSLEKNKMDLVQHSYLQAKQVFEELQKIAENSSIKLDGKSRRMLRIVMDPLSENEEDNFQKMKDYVDIYILMVKKDMKEGKEIEDIQRKIIKTMSTRELLNVISDMGKMSIQAFKVDISNKNSGYKSWEEVVSKNSGGERFVSYFAVIVALISYTRTSMKYVDDYQRNKDTKVLIMDNPFGPISSEHLLKPMFEIAKKYNTQLICLSDLKQNSIMNCFNLIYMIKIRQNVFGTAEYIQLKQQMNEEIFIEKEEHLEKAVFNVEEQISLF